MRAALLAVLLLVGAAPPDGEPVSIPMPGSPEILAGRVCAPPRGGKWNLAVINHGSPAGPEQRAAMQPIGCGSEPVRWFTQRGFLVIAALRRGFGLSTGQPVEDSGACDAPDYLASAMRGAEDIDAILRFGLARKDARPDHPVVVGQSTGGWATIAANGTVAPETAIFISFAGGRGAHAFAQPPTNCRPDLLAGAAAALGARARAPMLWVSAANDSFFPVTLMRDLQRAYNEAGGRAELAVLPAFGAEGHALFQGSGGSRLWGPVVERYLAERRQDQR